MSNTPIDTSRVESQNSNLVNPQRKTSNIIESNKRTTGRMVEILDQYASLEQIEKHKTKH